MLKRIIVGGFMVGMVAAIVIGVIQLAAPAAEAQGRVPRRAVEEGTTVGRGNGGRGQGGGSGALAPDAGTTLAAQGQGRGHGVEAEWLQAERDPAERIEGREGYGGQGQPRAEPEDWVTAEGTVLETSELVIETTAGEAMEIGLGPSHYREEQVFVLRVGDQVRVHVYSEGGEFKASEVENLSTGETIVLRDVYGRPMWAGQGRRNS